MTQEQQIKITYDQLSKTYDGKVALSINETCQCTGESPSTLYRQRKAGAGMRYIKRAGKNGRIFYSLLTIARYAVENNIKTI